MVSNFVGTHLLEKQIALEPHSVCVPCAFEHGRHLRKLKPMGGGTPPSKRRREK